MEIVLNLGSLAMALTALGGLLYATGRGLLLGLDAVVQRHTDPLVDRLARVERKVDNIDRKGDR